ncbi:MAG: SIR2 family protein [Acidobacteriota bacterium]|nr:SIR2 family protein [Acidobacteriota bacterium]
MDEPHDPLQCVKQLRQTLAADKLSIGFFLGAGCPCAIRVPRDGSDGSDPLIPDIDGLTQIVAAEIESSEKHQEPFARLRRILSEDGYAAPNVEKLLSCIRSLREAAGNGEVRGLNAKNLDELDKEVCRAISARVTRDLPTETTPYHSLARLVGGYRVPSPEIFTTNYDLLAEQALESLRVPFFDGFVGSSQPFFDQRAIEDDKAEDAKQRLPDRWCRLWKLHGSVNWRFNSGTRAITRSRETGDGEELLIHPSQRKYDESRRRPYSVMIDRLKEFVRNKKEPVTLLAVGHSFSDDHLNETIGESLRANSSAVCLALQYGKLSQYPAAAELARSEPNFWLLASDAAIIRRREAEWVAKPTAEAAAFGGAFEFVEPDTSGDKKATDEPRPCRFRLGHFNHFGDFVEEFSRPPVGGHI